MGTGQPVVGHVAELWRYPVKSLGGEQLEEVRCSLRGVEGDRRWAVVGADGKIGSGKTTKRFRRMPGLLSLSAFTDEDGTGWIRFPGGDELPVDEPKAAEAVGEIVGERVTLEREGPEPYFDDAPLHLVTSASIRWLGARRPHEGVERRRFRPNVLVAWAEEVGREGTDGPGDGAGWVGGALRMGEVRAQVERQTIRCVMTTMVQPGLSFAPGILQELTREVGAAFGVYARVVEKGAIRIGDEISWLG